MKGNSFSVAVRLNTSADYSRVFRRPNQSSSDAFFSVIWKRQSETTETRLGQVVAKKHIPKAVGRNRLKRLIRESFRISRTSLPGCDIVVLAKAPSNLADNQALLNSLAKHWLAISQDVANENHTD